MFCYPQSMNDTLDRLFPFNPYYPNKLYKSPDGIYVLKNTKGYFHIFRPCKIKYDGQFDHYEITNYLLTKNNTLKEISCCGNYKSREDVIQYLDKEIKS